MSTYSIHIFTPQDTGEALDLWRSTPGIGISDADQPERIAAYLERNPGLSFVARVDGRLAGAVLCGSDGRRGYLHHLAVASEFRHMGIGTVLSERCLAGLHELGITKCHLFVMAGNAGGRAFWEQVGWRLRTDLLILSKDIH
jgi:ribosomal protein S18 acetylase RimI-like enzyme